MATRNKIFQPNEIYFLTFTTDKYANLVYKWFDYMKDHYGNRIYGYVIMPNHIHVLLKVTHHSPPVSKLIQNAKRFLAYQIVDYLQEERDSLQSLDRRLQRGRKRGSLQSADARLQRGRSADARLQRGRSADARLQRG